MNDRLKNAKGILFDLDNTLYPSEKGIFSLINERINQYVETVTGRERTEVDSLRREYKDNYGTTLGGLLRHDGVDAKEYLEFVHSVPVEDLLEPDPRLARFLASISLPMAIFTNGTHAHAERVLDALGVSMFFKGICDLVDTGYLGKPHKKAFETAVDLLDCTLEETIFVDDLAVNVHAGNACGALSIHVNGHDDSAGDMVVSKVTELEEFFLPMPWYGKKVSGV